jgi:hypothetical protein
VDAAKETARAALARLLGAFGVDLDTLSFRRIKEEAQKLKTKVKETATAAVA